MKKDVDFLNFIYQNAKQGIINIDNIKEKVNDIDFVEVLANQKCKYTEIADETAIMLNELGYTEKEIGKLKQISSYIISNLEALKDESVNNIAKILVNSSNTGITDINIKLNEYANNNPRIIRLANKLLVLEQHNLNDLKKFL